MRAILSDGERPARHSSMPSAAAAALLFASKRWGDGTGDMAYSTQAKTLLDKMANNGMFDKSSKLVLFGVNASYTDASYVLPAFSSRNRLNA